VDEATLKGLHEQNRKSWNAAVPAHNNHKRDQAGFLRSGGSTLFPEELEALGDVDGKSLVHLQCNCGQDSLSLASLGARVTGIDIADDAIGFAQQLAEDTGIEANFVRSDLFDWFDETEQTFDLAFSTYGTIAWLADLDRWARGVHKVLAPGGRLVLLEFHPLAWSFTATGKLTDSYFLRGPIEESAGVNDYVGPGLAPSGFTPSSSPFLNPEPAHCFQWTVAQIVQSLVDAQLRIESMREYPYANGCEVMAGMRALPGNRFSLPERLPEMPLMLSLTATRESR